MTISRIESCVAFGGPVGVVNNYAAELMAILAVCEIAPLGTNIQIITDSLPSIQAISKFSSLTKRKQIRQPARPILNALNETVKNRHLSLRLEHIKSHQSVSDWKTHGNDIADRVAKLASHCNKNRYLSVNLEMGEGFVCMKRIDNDEPLINDPRREIAEILKQKEIVLWQDSSQGLTIRSTKGLEMLRKWKKETIGTDMESLGLILWTQLFPTSLNFKKISPKNQLWPVSCTFCHSNCIDNDQHLLNCPASTYVWEKCFQKIQTYFERNPKESSDIMKKMLHKLQNSPQIKNERKPPSPENIQLEKLAKSINVSSVWTLAWTELKPEVLMRRSKISLCKSENTKDERLTKELIKNLKNESAIIIEPRTSHNLISEYHREIEKALKKRDPFRLVFLHSRKYQLPSNLHKFSAVIAQSLEFTWTILVNPHSLVLDPTNWYNVEQEISAYHLLRTGQKVLHNSILRPKIPFPNRKRTRNKNANPKIPDVIKLLPNLNPFKNDSRKFLEVLNDSFEQQEITNTLLKIDFISEGIFFSKETETTLNQLMTIHALKFIKSQVIDAIRTVIMIRFKNLEKTKSVLEFGNIRKMWINTINTNLDLEEYRCNKKSKHVKFKPPPLEPIK